jgi:hypothetical protein
MVFSFRKKDDFAKDLKIRTIKMDMAILDSQKLSKKIQNKNYSINILS